MKRKNNLPKMLPNEVLGQLNKIKTFPKQYLYKVLCWLLQYIDYYHHEAESVDYYIIPVLKQAVATVSTKRVKVENGELIVAEGKYPLGGIVGFVREDGVVNMYLTSGDPKWVTASISELDEVLKGFGFFSPKNNSAINISFITSIDKGQSIYVHLKNNLKVKVTLSLKSKLKRLHKEHQQRI